MDDKLSYTHVGMWTVRGGREISLFSRPASLGFHRGNYIHYAGNTRVMLKWLDRCAKKSPTANRWQRFTAFISKTSLFSHYPWGEVKYDKRRDRFCFDLHQTVEIDWDVILFLVEELNLTDETVVLRCNNRYVF